MSQFASTLYPQTNPSNTALIRYREHIKVTNSFSVNPCTPAEWMRVMDKLHATWSAPWTTSQLLHARKVLTRLANFTG